MQIATKILHFQKKYFEKKWLFSFFPRNWIEVISSIPQRCQCCRCVSSACEPPPAQCAAARVCSYHRQPHHHQQQLIIKQYVISERKCQAVRVLQMCACECIWPVWSCHWNPSAALSAIKKKYYVIRGVCSVYAKKIVLVCSFVFVFVFVFVFSVPPSSPSSSSSASFSSPLLALLKWKEKK